MINYFLVSTVIFKLICASLDDNRNTRVVHDESFYETKNIFFDAEKDTKFLLFTRNNPSKANEITWNKKSILNSNFNASNQVRFIIHGLRSDPTDLVVVETTQAYLKKDNYNIIAVDWSEGSGAPDYPFTDRRVTSIGSVVARFVDFLDAENFTRVDQVTLVGHSIGAHIAGATGKRVKRGKINTIFGLDPANYLFDKPTNEERLEANDATYTQGIRTNAGFYGYKSPMTHADFYPNWGIKQPGCGRIFEGFLHRQCSHSRAHQFFAESIISDRFRARRCEDYQQIVDKNCPGNGEIGVMGGDTWSFGLRGIYFLETNKNSPFAQG